MNLLPSIALQNTVWAPGKAGRAVVAECENRLPLFHSDSPALAAARGPHCVRVAGKSRILEGSN